MVLLALTTAEKARDPTPIIEEFIEGFADRWVAFFCNSIIADMEDGFLNGDIFNKLVEVKTHDELETLIGNAQRTYLKLSQTVSPSDQLEAVLTVMDNIIAAAPGWSQAIVKLKSHLQDNYRARYCTRIGLNTLSNIILLAAKEPKKLLQIYPWIASNPAVRKRLSKSALYRKVNEEHLQALINDEAEDTLSIKMAKVFALGSAGGIPELTLYNILKPQVFENALDEDQTRNRDINNENISPGDMLLVAPTQQLRNLAAETLNEGMSQFNGLPSDRTLEPPTRESLLQTLVEARKTESILKKRSNKEGFQCCYVSSAAPDVRTGMFLA